MRMADELAQSCTASRGIMGFEGEGLAEDTIHRRHWFKTATNIDLQYGRHMIAGLHVAPCSCYTGCDSVLETEHLVGQPQ